MQRDAGLAEARGLAKKNWRRVEQSSEVRPTDLIIQKAYECKDGFGPRNSERGIPLYSGSVHVWSGIRFAGLQGETKIGAPFLRDRLSTVMHHLVIADPRRARRAAACAVFFFKRKSM